MFPLTDTNLLAFFIIASTLEAISLDNLSQGFERFILERKHAGKKLEDIAKDVFEELKSSGAMAVGIEADNPYTPARGKDIQFWKDAKDLAFARANIRKLTVRPFTLCVNLRQRSYPPIIRRTVQTAVSLRSTRNGERSLLVPKLKLLS